MPSIPISALVLLPHHAPFSSGNRCASMRSALPDAAKYLLELHFSQGLADNLDVCLTPFGTEELM